MAQLIPWRRNREEMVPTIWKDFQQEFDELTRRFFGEDPWMLPARMFDRVFSPTVDILETDDEIVVKAEMPGIDEKDIKVEMSGNMLTIKGEKKEEKNEDGANYHRHERSFGRFSRSFTLPSGIKEDQVKAKFKDGTLSLTVPKAESSKKKSIEIKVEH